MMEKKTVEEETSPQDACKDSPVSPDPLENASEGKSRRCSEISLSIDWSYIMWENDSNICWLDASMVLLAHNKTMRSVITLNPDCQVSKIIKNYDKAITTLNDFSSDQSTEERLIIAREILQKVREDTLKYLQPLIKCKKGEPDSAFCSLLNLIKEDKLIQGFFDITYMWVRLCDNCDLQRVLKATKPIITISNVDKFIPQKHISPFQCQMCNKKGQKMELVYKKLPKCLIFHFENGAGEGNDLPLQFIIASREYQLTAVVMLEKSQESNVNHFVTYVREPSVNKWLECNDLDLDIITFSEIHPKLDLSDVYIYVYETLDNLGTVEIEDDLSLRISDHNIPCIDLSDEEDTNKASQVGNTEQKESQQGAKSVTKLSSDIAEKTLNPAKTTEENQLSEKSFFSSNQDIQLSYLSQSGVIERETKSWEDKKGESTPKNKKSKINAESYFNIDEFLDGKLSEMKAASRLGNAFSLATSNLIKKNLTNNKSNSHHETTQLSKLPEPHINSVKDSFTQSKRKQEKGVTCNGSSTLKKTIDIPCNKEQTLITKKNSDKMQLTADEVEENRKVDVLAEKKKHVKKSDDKVNMAVNREEHLTANKVDENISVNMVCDDGKHLIAKKVDKNKKVDMAADEGKHLIAKLDDENGRVDIVVDNLSAKKNDENKKVDMAVDEGKHLIAKKGDENRKVDMAVEEGKHLTVKKSDENRKVNTAVNKKKYLTAKKLEENRKIDMATDKEKYLNIETVDEKKIDMEADKQKDLDIEKVDENRKIDMDADKQKDITAGKVDENQNIDMDADKQKDLNDKKVNESRKVDIAVDKEKLCNGNKPEILTPLKKVRKRNTVKNRKNDPRKKKCNDLKSALSSEVNEGKMTSNNSFSLSKMVTNPLKKEQVLITKSDSNKINLTATKVEVPVSKENFCNGKKIEKLDMKKIEKEHIESKLEKSMSMNQITVCPIVNGNVTKRNLRGSAKKMCMGQGTTISPNVNGNVSNSCEPCEKKNIQNFFLNNKPCKGFPAKRNYNKKRVSEENNLCISPNPCVRKKANLLPNSLIDHITNVLDDSKNYSNPKQVFVRLKDSSKSELKNVKKIRKKCTIKDLLKEREQSLKLLKTQTIAVSNSSNDLKRGGLFGACKEADETALLLQNSLLYKTSTEEKPVLMPVSSDKTCEQMLQMKNEPSCSFSATNSTIVFNPTNQSPFLLAQSGTEHSTVGTVKNDKTVRKAKSSDCAVKRKLSFNKDTVGGTVNDKSPSKAKKNILKVKMFPQYCRKQSTDDDDNLSRDQFSDICNDMDYSEKYVNNSPSPKRRKVKVPLTHPAVSSTCKVRFAYKKKSCCDMKNCYCCKVSPPTVVPNSSDLILLQMFEVSPVCKLNVS